MTSTDEIHWVCEAGQTEDPWHRQRLDEVGGRLIYTTYSTDMSETRELIDDARRLVEISGMMDLDHCQLARAMAVVDRAD